MPNTKGRIIFWVKPLDGRVVRNVAAGAPSSERIVPFRDLGRRVSCYLCSILVLLLCLTSLLQVFKMLIANVTGLCMVFGWWMI